MKKERYQYRGDGFEMRGTGEMGEKGKYNSEGCMGKGRKGGESEGGGGGGGGRDKEIGRGMRRNGMGIRGRRDWDIRKGNLKESVWGMVFREQIAYTVL